MSPAFEFFIYVTVLLLLALVIRRIMLWRLEQELKEPLSQELDRLIAEAADHEHRPLNDLHITRAGASSDRRSALFFYDLYPQTGDWFEFVRHGDGPRYRLVRWRYNDRAPYFPPWGLGTCRAPWFVDRMKRLTELLENYPRDRLLSVRALQALDAMDESEDLQTAHPPA